MKYLFAALIVGLTAGWGADAGARAWSADQVEELERAAGNASAEGVPNPTRALDLLALYQHLSDIDARYEAERDGIADGLFQSLAQVYAQGAVEPALIDPDWHIATPPAPDFAALDRALDAGVSPATLLARLLPQTPEYRALRAELVQRQDSSESGDAQIHINQLRANLERWRWLPRDLPARRVEVRLAEFALYFHRPAGEPLRHTVIVGAPRSPSPVFTATIESVTLNPDWDPPGNIVANELLPRFRRNPAAAAREGFQAVDDSGRVVAGVDWRQRPFPYHLRQRPGAQNALGRLRFDLPNPYAVYLHDTPSKSLFARSQRALSHGCIRVENPLALAAAVFDTPDWDEAALQRSIDTGASQSVPVPAPTPIYVLYLTTAVQADGSILYLADVYHRDAAIVSMLDAPQIPVAALAPLRSGFCSP